MSQCVPRWDLDDNQAPSKPSFRSHSNATSQDGPMVDDYEVAELTWENGQLALHGLGQPRVPAKPIACTSLSTRHTWEKTRTGGTLESIVNQATCLPLHKSSQPAVNQATCLPLHKSSQPAVNGDLVPWFHRHEAAVSMNMDALVPGSDRTKQDVRNTPVTDSVPPRVGCSTRVGSCSDPYATQDEDALLTAGKRARVARVPAAAPEWSIGDQSASHSATFGREYSKHMAMDPRERDMSTAEGFTSTTSFGSQENTSTGKPCSKSSTPFPDENDSVCHSRPQKKAGDEENKKKATGKSSVSTKRSRAAAIHNQSERV